MPDPEEKTNPEEESTEKNTEEEADAESEEGKEESEGEEESKESEEEKEKVVSPEEIEVETRFGKEPESKEIKESEKAVEGEEIDPDDEKTIGKVVDKRLASISNQLKEVQRLRDETEVTSFLTTKPEYTKYRGVMLKYISHPAYSDVPIHNIAAIVAASDLQKLGAKKEREAQAKAKETQGSGSPARKPEGGKVNWQGATKEEFEQKRNEIMYGNRE